MNTYELYHHGIKGQKWGVRRYQNPDGTLTDEGRKKYGTVENLNKSISRKKTATKVAVGAAGAAVGVYAANKIAKAAGNNPKIQKAAFNTTTKLVEKVGYVPASKILAAIGGTTAGVSAIGGAALGVIGHNKISILKNNNGFAPEPNKKLNKYNSEGDGGIGGNLNKKLNKYNSEGDGGIGGNLNKKRNKYAIY